MSPLLLSVSESWIHNSIDSITQISGIQIVKMVHRLATVLTIYLVEPSFASAKRCWTWVANMFRRSTELHWILDYKHVIIIIIRIGHGKYIRVTSALHNKQTSNPWSWAGVFYIFLCYSLNSVCVYVCVCVCVQ